MREQITPTEGRAPRGARELKHDEVDNHPGKLWNGRAPRGARELKLNPVEVKALAALVVLREGHVVVLREGHVN